MTPDAELVFDAVNTLREILRPLIEHLDAIDAKIAALERRPGDFKGPWQENTRYETGDGVEGRPLLDLQNDDARVTRQRVCGVEIGHGAWQAGPRGAEGQGWRAGTARAAGSVLPMRRADGLIMSAEERVVVTFTGLETRAEALAKVRAWLNVHCAEQVRCVCRQASWRMTSTPRRLRCTCWKSARR